MTGDEHQEGRDLGLPAGVVADLAGAGPRDGLSWSWELDIEALLAAVTGPAPWNRGPVKTPSQPTAADAPKAAPDSADHPAPPATAPDSDVPDSADGSEPPAAVPAPGPADADPVLDPADADLAEYLDAVEAGRSQILPLPVVAGRVAELVPAGPGLAGWLGASEASGLEDGALAGVAASYRRLASWAQAGELAVIAELASRSAKADDRIGVDEQGRPGKVPVDACAEVSLALAMSQAAATWWTDLAVTLRWRLAATGLALAAGTIDLGRARAIADATACLDEDTARAVQDKVLPKAGDQTTGQLRAALRRAVITADPQGADRRREEAEKRARVMLYPDDDGTASLGGYNLPGISATAAMARICALARALQASGAGGGIDLLRGHVFLGLLLGTLPHIPPPAGAPPDQPPDDEPPDDGPPDHGQPDDGPPADGPPGDEPQDGSPPGEDLPRGGTARGRAPAGCPGREDHGSRRQDRDVQRGGQGKQRNDQAASPASHSSHRNDHGDQSADQRSDTGDQRTDREAPPRSQDIQPADRGSQPGQPRDRGDPGPPGDRGGQHTGRDASHSGRDRPPDPHTGPGTRENHGEPADDTDDDGQRARPPPAWPQVPAFLQPGPAAMNHLTPAAGAAGLLDLRLPWTTLTRESPQPGHLSRLGPITPNQARHLADLAATDPTVRWRIILTNPDGHAIATTTITRPKTRAETSPGTSHQAGLIKQVTVTIGPGSLTDPHPQDLPPAQHHILTAARTLAAHTAEQAARDARTTAGCAHTDATTSYRPTTRLRDYITARDLTCRFTTCRQPATRCDLDHTIPYDQGGPTCSCNLGGACRCHHKIKQHPRWRLDQPTPGTFIWTTPTGRQYTTQPDSHTA